jgi:hypothetical protein
MLLLNVCSAWTHIALFTPALWASINLEILGSKILQLWLERARHCTLSISLHKSLDNGVATILRKYAEQLKRLELYEEDPDIELLLFDLPCLEILTFGSPDYDPEDLYALSLPPIMGLLSLAPNLVECTFLNISIDFSVATESKMILPRLRCLKFGVLGPGTHGGDVILSHLSLPALEELVVPLYQITSSDFSLFLEESLSLQRLAGNSYKDIEFVHLDEWLRLVPTLTDLEFFTYRSIFADNLFSTLADSPSDFLPNLRSLKIQHQSPALSLSSYQSLLRALSTRHTRLSCFHLQALNEDEPKPPADVCDGLRRLVADGMEIYIGGRGENYISL